MKDFGELMDALNIQSRDNAPLLKDYKVTLTCIPSEQVFAHDEDWTFNVIIRNVGRCDLGDGNVIVWNDPTGHFLGGNTFFDSISSRKNNELVMEVTLHVA